MRVFVIHDEEGNIVSVAQFEELSEEVDRPFHVANAKHGVVELDKDDEGFKAVVADRTEGKKKGLLKVHSDFTVEAKRGGGKGLVKKEGRPIIHPPDKSPAPGPAPPDREPRPVPNDKTPTDPKRPPIVVKKEEPGTTPPTRHPTQPEEK